MKRKHIFIAIAVVCAGVALYALSKLHGPASGGDDDDDEAQQANANVQPIIPVQVGALKRVTLHQYVTGYGSVDAAPATATQPAAGGPLSAPTAGTVAKVNVIAGQQVNKGDVLVELNSASTTIDYARDEVDRQEQLFGQQNTSLKNLQDAKAQLASLEVIAPVSGTVTSVNVVPGQAVDTTTAVAEVIDLSRLAVTAKIPAAQAGQLQTGQEVQVLTQPPVTTSLSFVGPQINADDGTVTAWASLPVDSGLRPGQFVQFRIVTAAHTNCLAAPVESVVADDNGNSFIPVVDGNEATQTPVQAGFREDDWVEISAPGLKEGDQVVTVGAYGLPDKTQIKIVNPLDDATNSPGAQ
ncbi:MAG TPA: efflux RND transporter periplasmic adaptor subunit [Verrucomicrobiae bacterium]|jgi:RND family efflux transporter MFP subunit|nr:efflux RND transporter periplasmic adaptor subunit [Verrucomicrobiae bacterium]